MGLELLSAPPGESKREKITTEIAQVEFTNDVLVNVAAKSVVSSAKLWTLLGLHTI